jgi:ureidoglycolate lyase
MKGNVMDNNIMESKELTLEDFRKYGSYVKLPEASSPSFFKIGKPPIEFFPDLLSLNLDNKALGISLCQVQPRQGKIDLLEHHNRTEEGILPLDGEVFLQLGGPTEGEVTPWNIELFRIPKLTFVSLKRGVWHHAPFVVGNKVVNILILLAERTYHSDSELKEITEIPINNIPG